jgi:hypothetical protein
MVAGDPWEILGVAQSTTGTTCQALPGFRVAALLVGSAAAVGVRIAQFCGLSRGFSRPGPEDAGASFLVPDAPAGNARTVSFD